MNREPDGPIIGPARVVSVPYTGTRYTMELLARHGFGVEQVHTYNPLWRQWIGGKVKCVVPIRDPMMHAISCRYRNATLRTHQFEQLAERVDVSKCFPVDLPDRAPHLRRLSDYMGVEITEEARPKKIGSTDDELGLRRRYIESGIFEGMENALAGLGPRSRALLKELGYTMEWL